MMNRQLKVISNTARRVESVVCNRCDQQTPARFTGECVEGIGTCGYTDGRIEGKPAYAFVDDPLVIRCQNCREVQLVSSSQTALAEEKLSWRETLTFIFLDRLPTIPIDETAHVEFLRCNAAAGDAVDATAIRKQLLRFSNDRIRHLSPEAKVPLVRRDESLVEQVRILAETIDHATAGDVAICVECYRELGDFELAIKHYEQLWKFSDDHARACGIWTIIEKCKLGDPQVCKYTDFAEEIDD